LFDYVGINVLHIPDKKKSKKPKKEKPKPEDSEDEEDQELETDELPLNNDQDDKCKFCLSYIPRLNPNNPYF
jgi:hypothetical protein